MSINPVKIKRKEVGEGKKSRKLKRTILVMTYTGCNVGGHNKRWCPHYRTLGGLKGKATSKVIYYLWIVYVREISNVINTKY